MATQFRHFMSRSNIGTKAALLLVLSSSVLFVDQAYADTTDTLLDQLARKGVLTKSEYRNLKARHAAETAQRAPVVAAAGGTRRLVTKEGIVEVPNTNCFRPFEPGMGPGKGVGLHLCGVDIKVGGNINVIGAYQFAGNGTFGGNNVIAGGLAGQSFDDSFSIRNGLLPANFNVDITTQQEGIDIGVHFGVYPGIGSANVAGPLNANQRGSSVALGTVGVDFRQIYATIGTPDFGTVKAGRDLGLFGGDAILLDASIFGIGSPLSNANPTNTSLGRIGVGYVYADFIPQVTYTTPDVGGFTASFGVFEPLHAFNFSGFSSNNFTGPNQNNSEPQLQGRLKYVGKVTPDIDLTAWLTGVTQEQQHLTSPLAAVPFLTDANQRSYGVDGGAKVGFGPFTVLGYGYYGQGLGTTGLFFDGFDSFGRSRGSYGGYVQATYGVTDRLTVFGSAGASYLDRSSTEAANNVAVLGFDQSANLVARNASAIGGARYKLTDWVNLQAEYIYTVTRSHQNIKNDDSTLAAGAILFF